MSRVSWGTGTGWKICTCAKPIPVSVGLQVQQSIISILLPSVSLIFILCILIFLYFFLPFRNLSCKFWTVLSHGGCVVSQSLFLQRLKLGKFIFCTILFTNKYSFLGHHHHEQRVMEGLMTGGPKQHFYLLIHICIQGLGYNKQPLRYMSRPNDVPLSIHHHEQWTTPPPRCHITTEGRTMTGSGPKQHVV